jgi:hypothetical protein
MDPTTLKHEIQLLVDKSKAQQRHAHRSDDPTLLLIHRARQAALKEVLALLDKLTIGQP